MDYTTREYPLFSACGLNCGLCPRFYTVGASRCPGCAGEGFSAVHPPCGVLSCCQRNGLEYCFLCDEFPCKKFDGADAYDSFISHKNQLTDLAKAKEIGIEAYKAELDEKVALLNALLTGYDDGRRKSFYCVAVSLLDLESVRSVLKQLPDRIGAGAAPKQKAEVAARLFTEAAEQCGVSLKLRKKS